MLVLVVLVLVYTSVHSGPVVPFSGNISTVHSTVRISTHYTPPSDVLAISLKVPPRDPRGSPNCCRVEENGYT